MIGSPGMEDYREGLYIRDGESKYEQSYESDQHRGGFLSLERIGKMGRTSFQNPVHYVVFEFEFPAHCKD
jgi:hypothetical protein